MSRCGHEGGRRFCRGCRGSRGRREAVRGHLGADQLGSAFGDGAKAWPLAPV